MILKERKQFFQFSVIFKNSSYRTLKIALKLSVGSNREVTLGCVWVRATVKAGIRKPESGNGNPETGIRKPESGIRNPESGIRNPELRMMTGKFT